MTYTKIPMNGDPEFYLRVASGRVNHYSIITKFGTNEAVGTSTEDVWSPGGTLTYLTAAATLEAISSSVNDTAAGSGAQTIRVYGLDANLEVITEDITMNGTSATTATTQSFFRVYRAFVLTCGTYGGTNAGTITIRVSSGGSTQAEIAYHSAMAIGAGQTMGTHYTIPADYTAYIVGMRLDVATTKSINYSILVRENANDVTTPFTSWRTLFHAHGATSDNLVPPVPMAIPEKTDVRVVAVADSGTSEVAFNYQLLQIRKAR